MTAAKAREWVTPGLIIEVVTILVSVTIAWAGLKSDLRSLSEHQATQDKSILEYQNHQDAAIRDLTQKMPNPGVIEIRLHNLEAKAESVDPSTIIAIRADIEGIKREIQRQQAKIELNQDYTEGRVFDLPYRVPSKRHRKGWQ